jgi:hypothetical protein
MPAKLGSKMYVIKAAIGDPRATTFHFTAHKTMYGGKAIAAGDVLYLFASENAGGRGLVARGLVLAADAMPRVPGLARQTPRVNVAVRSTGIARHPLGRDDLRTFRAWGDGRPETELNFKLYRQATDKIVGITPAAAAFLARCF